jgi:hypothetical protein
VASLTTTNTKQVEETVELTADVCFSKAAEVLTHRSMVSNGIDHEAAKVWIALGRAVRGDA